jgi:hypothetical protein
MATKTWGSGGFIWLVGLAGMVIAATVTAQEMVTLLPLKPSGDAAGIKAEPFAIFPAASAWVGHVDNLLYASDNKVSSGYTSVAPAVIGELKSGLNIFTAGYVGQWGWYNSSSADNFNDHHLGATGKMPFSSRLRLDVAVDYFKQHDPRGSTDRAISSEPDRWHSGGADAILNYGAKDAQGRLEFEVSGADKRYENNRAITVAADRDFRYYSGTFYYRVMPKTSLLFQVSRSSFDYLDDATLLDNTETRYLVGATWDVTAITSGTVKLGQLKKDFTDSSRRDFSGFSWEANARWSPRTYSHVDLTTSRTTYDPTGIGDFILTRFLGVRWTHDWTDRISSAIDAYTADDKYTGAERDDKRNSIGFRLTYKMRRWLKLGAEYNYTKRDSNLDGFDFTRNIFMLSVAATL